MRRLVMIGAVIALGAGPTVAGEREQWTTEVTAPPAEASVTIEAPEGTSEEEIAAALSQEHAKREPSARMAAEQAKRAADADQRHAARIGKVCDSIPESALRKDPSLRRMCR